MSEFKLALIQTPTTWKGMAPNVFPDFQLSKCVSMINYDTVARGALNHFVAKCMENCLRLMKSENKNGLLKARLNHD